MTTKPLKLIKSFVVFTIFKNFLLFYLILLLLKPNFFFTKGVKSLDLGD